MPNDSHRFCVAPMLDWTTPECRALHRLFTRRALLYTEMVTTGALIYGDVERHLQHHGDAPCALQLGGGEQAAAGAVPVTVKHRLAIDEQDEREVFHFVETVASRSPCRVFIIHARKAWLQGLSPKANRDVPPLNYPLVYEVKRRFPELTIVINGGIGDLAQCQAHLQHVDGVMLGRAAYQNPELLLLADTLYGEAAQTLDAVLPRIRALIAERLARGEVLSHYTRHLLGLFPGVRGAKIYRRILSEDARAPDAGIAVFERALAAIGHI